jgi:hypothetical protein
MDLLIKKYENIRLDMSIDSKIIRKAITIVHKYIIKKDLILVGGQSMDYALRKKGMFLYPQDSIPDLDFFSPNHYQDANNIAQELIKAGFPEVNIINAMHITTRRVRIKNIVVADVTYVPIPVPYIIYEHMRIVHPILPISDQLRSIACPTMFEPREVVFSRFQKDFKRMQLMISIYNPTIEFQETQHNTNKYELTMTESKLLTFGDIAGIEILDEKAVTVPNTEKQIQTVFLPSYVPGITRFISKFQDLLNAIQLNIGTWQYYDKILDYPARAVVTLQSNLKIIYYITNDIEYSIQQTQPNQQNKLSIMTAFWQSTFEYLSYHKPSMSSIHRFISLFANNTSTCLLSNSYSTPDNNTSHAIKTQLDIMKNPEHKKEIPKNLYEKDLTDPSIMKHHKSIDYKHLSYFNSISGAEVSLPIFQSKYK